MKFILSLLIVNAAIFVYAQTKADFKRTAPQRLNLPSQNQYVTKGPINPNAQTKKYEPVKTKVNYEVFDNKEWTGSSLIPGVVRLTPSNGLEKGNFRKYQFRKNGYFGVNLYNDGALARPDSIEYFIFPTEPETAKVSNSTNPKGQVQIDAVGTTWLTQSLKNNPSFQLKSQQCEVKYDNSPTGGFMSEKNFSVEKCNGKMLIALGYTKKSSALDSKNLSDRILKITFPSREQCQIKGEKLFFRKGGQFVIKSQSELDKAFEMEGSCAALYKNFKATKNAATKTKASLRASSDSEGKAPTSVSHPEGNR